MGWKKIVGIKGIKKKGRANATQVSIGTHRPIAFKIRLELYINKLKTDVQSPQSTISVYCDVKIDVALGNMEVF